MPRTTLLWPQSTLCDGGHRLALSRPVHASVRQSGAPVLIPAAEVCRGLAVAVAVVLGVLGIGAQRAAAPGICGTCGYHLRRRLSLFYPRHKGREHVEVVKGRLPAPAMSHARDQE